MIVNAKKITVLGSTNTDMVIKSARLPVPGETVIGKGFMMTPGGKGANQAVAVARLGGRVTFITKTGNDLFGRQSIELFSDENINTDYILSDPSNPSGVALISVDSFGENCIIVEPGANGSLSPEDVDNAKEAIEQADLLLMQLEIPMETVIQAATMAKAKGVKVILNPAPAQFLPNELLSNTSIIIPNRTEAEILSGIKVTDWASAKLAAKIISEKGISTVIITLSSSGALLKDGEDIYEIEAPMVEAVDTTAAGDTFCGALAVALAEGRNIVDSVKFANECASVTVTKMGAQISIPYRAEITESF